MMEVVHIQFQVVQIHLLIDYDATATVDDGSCTYPSTCAEDAPTGLGATNVIQNRATIVWDDMNSSLTVW